jgi:uncharacterized phage protein gp47/JayE
MAWNRPPLAQLIQESQQDIQSRFNTAGVPLPKSVLMIFATAFGNGFDALNGRIAATAKNILPDTSEDDIVLRQAAERGISRELATNAQGNVIFTGTIGYSMPSGQVVLRADKVQITTAASGTITSGTTVTIPVTLSVAGGAGNTPAGTPVTLGSSVPGFQTGAVVDSAGLTGGFDVEDIEALRARVIAYDQEEPTGGNLDDYVAWAKQVPGVTRAWAYKNYSGAGTVGLTFVMDNKSGSIIPASGDVATVQAYIDSVAPGTATNIVFAPTAVPMNPNIHLITADTPDIRTAINAELAALISSGIQADGSLGTKPGGTTYLNAQIIPAISAGQGVVSFSISTLIGASPADIVMSAGHILTLGTPVYV